MIITENSKTVMLILTLNIIIQLAVAKKVVVKYFGEDYLVDGGCKAKDETVLKWEIQQFKSNFSNFLMKL